MKIGFTSTSFRQIKSIEKIVRIASEAGADCIEWGGDIHIKDVPTARRAKRLCDDAGIPISSYGSYYRVGSKRLMNGNKSARYLLRWVLILSAYGSAPPTAK